jgi:3-dehydro-L-gulonate 2-dehydrogenase
LSGGNAAHQFDRDPLKEAGQSQVFLAIAPGSLAAIEELNAVAEGAIAAVHGATPIEEGKPARYPGEGARAKREESVRLGVAVEDAAWEAFVKLESEVA